MSSRAALFDTPTTIMMIFDIPISSEFELHIAFGIHGFSGRSILVLYAPTWAQHLLIIRHTTSTTLLRESNDVVWTKGVNFASVPGLDFGMGGF